MLASPDLSDSRVTSTIGNRIRTVAVFAVVGLVAVLSLELLISIVAPQPTRARQLRTNLAMYEANDIIPYTLKPGYEGRLARSEFDIQVKINSLGYRDDEFSKLPKPGELRILVAGDSHPFGWGLDVDNAFPNRLEKILREEHGIEANVINGGFAAGEYLDSYYLYLKHMGLELQPDIVIQTIAVQTDLDWDWDWEFEWPTVDENGLPTRVVSVISRVREDGYYVHKKPQRRYTLPILADSHLFHLVVSHVTGFIWSLKKDPAPDPVPNGGVELPARQYRAVYPERTKKNYAKVRRLVCGHGVRHEGSRCPGRIYGSS